MVMSLHLCKGWALQVTRLHGGKWKLTDAIFWRMVTWSPWMNASELPLFSFWGAFHCCPVQLWDVNDWSTWRFLQPLIWHPSLFLWRCKNLGSWKLDEKRILHILHFGTLLACRAKQNCWNGTKLFWSWRASKAAKTILEIGRITFVIRPALQLFTVGDNQKQELKELWLWDKHACLSDVRVVCFVLLDVDSDNQKQELWLWDYCTIVQAGLSKREWWWRS